MCKFTNRLFVFVLLTISALATTTPVIAAVTTAIVGKTNSYHQLHDDTTSNGNVRPRGGLLDIIYTDYDYYNEDEIHYDQRQKGEENLQLKLNGFLIALPKQTDGDFLEILDAMQMNDLLQNFNTDVYEKSVTRQPNGAVLPNENKLNKIETLVVKIPAPKKEAESRQQQEDLTSRLQYDMGGKRTKSHILQLLNLFRRNHKY